MPRYLIVRKFSVTQDEMPRIGRKSNQVGREIPGIVWEHSHVVINDDGTAGTYCVYEAPNEEAIMAHAMALGEHEYWVQEIVGDVTPDDFPLNGDEPS
jgi:Nickel responsive protein SCO4226-like